MFCLYTLPLARRAQAKIQMLTTSSQIVTILFKSLRTLTKKIQISRWQSMGPKINESAKSLSISNNQLKNWQNCWDWDFEQTLLKRII